MKVPQLCSWVTRTFTYRARISMSLPSCQYLACSARNDLAQGNARPNHAFNQTPVRAFYLAIDCGGGPVNLVLLGCSARNRALIA